MKKNPINCNKTRRTCINDLLKYLKLIISLGTYFNMDKGRTQNTTQTDDE